jgi:xylulose-5-phosphate/fructose-6-phosphate phosphoketolase
VNFLDPKEAEAHCVAGISTWKNYSTHGGEDPDVVLCGIGNETTTETVLACKLLKEDFPQLRIRVVNVVDLLTLAIPGAHPHALSDGSFDSIFTTDKPV